MGASDKQPVDVELAIEFTFGPPAQVVATDLFGTTPHAVILPTLAPATFSVRSRVDSSGNTLPAMDADGDPITVTMTDDAIVLLGADTFAGVQYFGVRPAGAMTLASYPLMVRPAKTRP